MPARLTIRRPGPDVRSARRSARLRSAVFGTAFVALLAPALSACGGDASSTAGNATLKWASSYFPTHWDPELNADTTTRRPSVRMVSAVH
ncbi:hypothetical protein ACWCQX_48065, partial [Streptomyces sp. NPDC002346]